MVLARGFDIIFKGDIATILGFEPTKEYRGNLDKETKIESEYTTGLKSGFSMIYVYTNIIEEQQIENQQKQLLRVVDWNSMPEDESVVRTFNRLYYYKLKTTRFDTIMIQIADDMGVPINFHGGKVLIVLEFRERNL